MAQEEHAVSNVYIEVTDQTWQDQVLKSDKPVVVDFWAPWCGPCRMMAPTFEELAGEYQGKMVFAKMNTDQNQMTPARLGIQGIPTMIFFQGGREVDRVVGAVRREVFKKHIDSTLSAVA